jgi:hypothetical protein
MTSRRITSSDGTTIGYVAVDDPRRQDGVAYGVSRAGRSRTTPTQGA